MTRVSTWLLLRLRLVIVPGWIVLAVVLATHLPSFTNETQNDISGLVPTNAQSASVEAHGIRAFGTPMLSRLAVVQRDPAGLAAAVQKRAFERGQDR